MRGTWTTETIAGHPVEFYDPPGVGCPGRACIFFHGIGLETLRDRPAFTNVLDEVGLPCACPHGGPSWWADRVCSEFDPQLTAARFVVEHVTPRVVERWGVTFGRIGLLGISMGGQGVLRLAFQQPRRYPVVAAIAAAIDYHEAYGRGTPLDAIYNSKEQCRQDTAPMHIRPSDLPSSVFFCIDPTDLLWYRGNDRLHEKLIALGVQHECDLKTQAGGHTWDYFNHMAERAIQFIHRGLTAQSRRLL